MWFNICWLVNSDHKSIIISMNWTKIKTYNDQSLIKYFTNKMEGY